MTIMARALFVLAFLALVACGSAVGVRGAQPKAAWKNRTIYQVITDRFAKSSDTTDGCYDTLGNYCGGTFLGIQNHLDYIQGMGFDAIWISPVVTNQPKAFHGYHAKNLFTINSNFGTAAQLNSLISAVHKRNMFIMVDVVANHMGAPTTGISPNYTYTDVVPFNNASHYHSCTGCPGSVQAGPCSIVDYTTLTDANMVHIQQCRTQQLPDLDQSNTYVSTQLQAWIKGLVANYSFDGIRIDTVMEVDKPFWSKFQKAAGCYAVGEAFHCECCQQIACTQPTASLLLRAPCRAWTSSGCLLRPAPPSYELCCSCV